MNEKSKKEGIIAGVRNSVILKVLTIGILMLLLLIPAAMVENLIHERQSRKCEAVDEISGKWGNAQEITGPIISVPYKTLIHSVVRDKNGKNYTKTISVTHNAYILPNSLKVNCEIVPEIRYRGIYKAVLYSADMKITGDFAPLKENVAEIAGSEAEVQWDKATISLGITDMRGIRKTLEMKINGKDLPLSAGSGLPDYNLRGLNGKVAKVADSSKIIFEISLSLNGSRQINFIPVGKSTEVSLTSTWDSPSFNGKYLPVERKIGKKGFNAIWRIFEFNRDYPQGWSDSKFNFADSSFGVRLFVGNDIYQQSIRTIKYAILFIVFTFAALFLAETISKTRVHPFQYMMSGLAVTVFYVLLISISEHLNFDIAYLLSSTAIVTLIFSYIKCFFKKVLMPILIAVIQIMLYVYFYVTLKSEDYALLMGSLGLFCVLAIVMYVTRKINWYESN
jgi:inner membrane protein